MERNSTEKDIEVLEEVSWSPSPPLAVVVILPALGCKWWLFVSRLMIGMHKKCAE